MALNVEGSFPPAREAFLVAGAYVTLTVWWLWPLPSVLSTHSGHFATQPVAVADFYLIAWALAWGAHALVTAPWKIFHANSFYPSTLSLAYSEHFLGYQPIFAPPYWLTGNPILAVNVVVFASYPLCGLATYLLARRFISGPPAALAGFFYAFCVWRRVDLVHLHMLGVQYIPLALLLTELWFERARTRDAVLLTLVLLLQTLSSFYLAYALALAYGPYLLLALWRWRALCDRRRLAGLGVVLVLVAAGMGILSLPYLELRRLGLIPSYGTDQPLAAGVLFAYRTAWRYLREQGVGPVGYALVLVAIVPPWRTRAWPRVLGVVLAALGTVAAFGAHIPIGGHMLRTPYLFLMDWIPGFASVRVPSRFAIVAQLGFALLAGIGCWRLLARWRTGIAWVAAVLIATLALRSVGPLPPVPVRAEPVGDTVPAAYRWLAQHGGDRAVLELPEVLFDRAARRMYLSTFHWLPTIGGHSAYAPGTATYIHGLARELPRERALQAVVDAVDVGWILVHLDEMSGASAGRWRGALPEGLERVAQWEDDLLLRVTRLSRASLRSRLLSTRETLGGIPLEPLGSDCPGSLRLASAPPEPWPPRSTVVAEIEVHNAGPSPWPASGFVPRHLVQLRACVGRHQGHRCAGWPVPLPSDVAPGDRVRVPVTVRTPFWPGSYVLEASLIQVGDGPLEQCGVAVLKVPVRVR